MSGQSKTNPIGSIITGNPLDGGSTSNNFLVWLSYVLILDFLSQLAVLDWRLILQFHPIIYIGRQTVKPPDEPPAYFMQMPDTRPLEIIAKPLLPRAISSQSFTLSKHV